MTMKKVICFLSFMVMTMIMTTSCTKPDNGPVIPTSITTLADLNGTLFLFTLLTAPVPALNSLLPSKEIPVQ
jgi:cation transporter-like permease